MKTLPFLFIPILLFFACKEASPSASTNSDNNPTIEIEPEHIKFFREHPQYKSTAFDYPVGKPDARGYYNAQGFQKNNHLGDDWNANTGGN
ncbi:MAG: M23 family peptidase, partial [Bacteroidota bacterium]